MSSKRTMGKKQWYVHSMEYYTAMKKSGPQTHYSMMKFMDMIRVKEADPRGYVTVYPLMSGHITVVHPLSGI